MGRAFPRRGRGGLAGPLLKAALIAKPNRAGRMRLGRRFTQAASYRRGSPPRSAFWRRLSAASSNAGASIACRRSSRPNRSVAMSGQPLARSSTSTSRSWASSVGPAIGSPAIGPAKAIRAGSAGNMCIWRSTTIPVSPTRKSCRTKNVDLVCALCSTPCASFETLASGSSASWPTTAQASDPIATKALRRLKIKHLRTRPYTPKTNGKAERFVRPACANGPTPGRTAPLKNAPPNCPSGCTATPGIALMAVSDIQQGGVRGG
jgi:hypothetical protein